MPTQNSQSTIAKSDNKSELDGLRSAEVIADVAEGFAEIDRGEYVVLTKDELLRKIRNAETRSG